MFWKLGSASAAVDLRSMDLLIQAEVWFTTAPEVVFETSIFSQSILYIFYYFLYYPYLFMNSHLFEAQSYCEKFDSILDFMNEVFIDVYSGSKIDEFFLNQTMTIEKDCQKRKVSYYKKNLKINEEKKNGSKHYIKHNKRQNAKLPGAVLGIKDVEIFLLIPTQ